MKYLYDETFYKTITAKMKSKPASIKHSTITKTAVTHQIAEFFKASLIVTIEVEQLIASATFTVVETLK